MRARLPEARESITNRQREVARLVAEGKTNPEIADALGISLDGAKYHVSELLGRLGLERREEIAAWYWAQGQPSLPRRLRAAFATPLTWFAAGSALTAVVFGVVLLFVALASGRSVPAAPEAARPHADVVEQSEQSALPEGPAVPMDAATMLRLYIAANDVPTRSPWQWPLPGPGRLYSLHSTAEDGEGIDILAAVGTTVRASRNGTVVFAGGDRCCGYGLHVVIAHDDGYETLYAYLERVDVRLGESVGAGSVIGLSGATGRTEPPMLHFAIRRDGVHLDALGMLQTRPNDEYSLSGVLVPWHVPGVLDLNECYIYARDRTPIRVGSGPECFPNSPID
jgi:murein DD-endopeptidase MepM/ murein hydrolase activator NlpD